MDLTQLSELLCSFTTISTGLGYREQGTAHVETRNEERRRDQRCCSISTHQSTQQHTALSSQHTASRIVSHHVKYFDRCRNLETELPLRRTFRACTVYSGLNQSSSLWRVERYKYHFDSLFCQGMIVLKSKTTATSQGYAPDV